MYITTIEGVVDRSEHLLVMALYDEIVLGVVLIWEGWFVGIIEVTIVVAHNLEHRYSDLICGKSISHRLAI